MRPRYAYAGRGMDAARMSFQPFSNAKYPRCGALLGLLPLQTYNNQTIICFPCDTLLSFQFSLDRCSSDIHGIPGSTHEVYKKVEQM